MGKQVAEQCLIALGSNLGDRESTLDKAVELLSATPGVKFLRVSRWYETEPVGGPAGQGAFLNGAALLATSLEPGGLLGVLQLIENQLGRVRDVDWGPRTLDLDLLLFGDRVIESPELSVPHPAMQMRRFVLEPAAEIASHLRHPRLKQTIGRLLEQLTATEKNGAMSTLQSEPIPFVVSTVAELRARARAERIAGRRIGLVPTMGALHEGHLSLARASKAACDFTIVTIFVNPTQFGPGEDYQRYPRVLEQDLQLLSQVGVDLVFAPTGDEMYPPGSSTFVEVEGLTACWEGAVRPEHFRGVTTIVAKLFNAAEPDYAFFGQKDYQQATVIRRMAADLNMPVDVRVCPIVRDADGLALSSRNTYLSVDERRRALVLSRSLQLAGKLVEQKETDAGKIVAAMREAIESEPGVMIDYVAIVDGDTLEPVENVSGTHAVAIVAARVGTTRLIDNAVLGIGE